MNVTLFIMYMGTRARLKISKVVHRVRTDNTIAKKRDKGTNNDYKTIHRKPKIELHELH